jgi:formylglycine-generating enzyme required for sulfatase activity
MGTARGVFGLVSTLVLAGLVLAAPALADKRVALVIGNGAYQYADKLSNPITDAQRMRDALAKLGFEVVFGEDLDKRSLEHKIGEFADAAQDADVALVYFAGHGATFGDTPYVVPIDAQFRSLGTVPYELVPVETLIGELRRAKGLRIAILDACRDNAAERSLKRVAARGGEVTRGLARVKNPEGLILAYATQYMSTAADGDPKGDSPFTAALLDHIATPGLDVRDLFFDVGRQVIATTKGAQRPEISVSFYDSYAFVPRAPAAAPADQTAAQAWAAVKDTTSIVVLDDFVRRFGDSIYGTIARERREQLRPKEIGQQAMLVPHVRPEGPCGGVTVALLSARSAQRLSPTEECGLKTRDVFKECDTCPEVVVVPAGSFTMGSPASENGRHDNEGPQHVVTINKAFAVGKFHVTRDQFAAFVAETRYDAGSKCWSYEAGKWEVHDGRSWLNPGFPQQGSHPAVCLSWKDAKAYVDWLKRKTGRQYRLLTEAEWEYAARGRTEPGAYPRYFFGDDEKDLCRHGNGADQTAKSKIQGVSGWTVAPCEDGYAYTSPVGNFAPNAFSLYDMAGNAWQWVQNCWHDSYQGAAAYGSEWTAVDCGRRVLRGGSWISGPRNLRAADRSGGTTDNRFNYAGFRVGRTLTP